MIAAYGDRVVTDETLAGALAALFKGPAPGGSTVHFAMVSLRFRPEWFKSKSQLGYGTDWPVDWREMWEYYGEVEQALKISGPVNYPWGPKRPRYPYRAHELNAAALVLEQTMVDGLRPARGGGDRVQPRAGTCGYPHRHRPQSDS